MSTPFDPPRFAVVEAVERALAEDLTPARRPHVGPAARRCSSASAAVRRARAPVCWPGGPAPTETFRQVDVGLSLVVVRRRRRRASSRARPSARSAGRCASILTAERTALNFLGHLSGIATLTRRFVDAAPATGSSTRVLGHAQDHAGPAGAREGGRARRAVARNHRGNLSDWVLLKDNHLGARGHHRCRARRASAAGPAARFTSSATGSNRCGRRSEAGADALLLDNMTPDELRDVHGRGHRGRRRPPTPPPLLEASGGISLENVAATPRPASTASRRGASPTRRRCSTSASTSWSGASRTT